MLVTHKPSGITRDVGVGNKITTWRFDYHEITLVAKSRDELLKNGYEYDCDYEEDFTAHVRAKTKIVDGRQTIEYGIAPRT
jgi:hypothetical protein